MDYETYYARAHEAAAHDAAGRYEQARDIFVDLASSTELAVRDRLIMFVNAAVTSGRLGESNTALAWFDRALECEARARFSYAAESRAAFLHEIGDTTRSRSAYEDLLSSGVLDEDGRARVRRNIETLEG